MAILADGQILEEIEKGTIEIKPFNREKLGSNSYDLHLAKTLLVYDEQILDAKKENLATELIIPPEGILLEPGILYLGVTQEFTTTNYHVPIIDGKSSIGRLGINIHATAGFGDIGYSGHWTLEIYVVQPVRIYAGMPIAQIRFETFEGDVINIYSKKKSAKYVNMPSDNPKPAASKMYKNFILEDFK